MISKNLKVFSIALIVLGGLLPLIVYKAFIGRVAIVMPSEARSILSNTTEAALVDVRSPSEYAAGHPEGARNWSYKEIEALKSADAIPADLRGRKLLFICRGGITSIMAAKIVGVYLPGRSYSVRGGIQEWIVPANAICPFEYPGSQSPLTVVPEPFRPSTPLVQWAVVFSAFTIKPLYMLLSLFLIVALGKPKTSDVASLQWAMIAFLAGESFCALNYVIYGGESRLVDYLHSYGMAVAFAFACYAILDGLDGRVVHFSDPQKRCALHEVCGACIKDTDTYCGIRRIGYFLIPVVFLLCFIPLVADFTHESFNTRVFGRIVNNTQPVILQMFEIRYAPAFAAALYAAAFAALWGGSRLLPWAKVLFSAGSGLLGFGLFRLILVAVYREDLSWYVNWEEFSEMIFVCGTWLILWQFRALCPAFPRPKT